MYKEHLVSSKYLKSTQRESAIKVSKYIIYLVKMLKY